MGNRFAGSVLSNGEGGFAFRTYIGNKETLIQVWEPERVGDMLVVRSAGTHGPLLPGISELRHELTGGGSDGDARGPARSER